MERLQLPVSLSGLSPDIEQVAKHVEGLSKIIAPKLQVIDILVKYTRMPPSDGEAFIADIKCAVDENEDVLPGVKINKINRSFYKNTLDSAWRYDDF